MWRRGRVRSVVSGPQAIARARHGARPPARPTAKPPPSLQRLASLAARTPNRRPRRRSQPPGLISAVSGPRPPRQARLSPSRRRLLWTRAARWRLLHPHPPKRAASSAVRRCRRCGLAILPLKQSPRRRLAPWLCRPQMRQPPLSRTRSQPGSPLHNLSTPKLGPAMRALSPAPPCRRAALLGWTPRPRCTPLRRRMRRRPGRRRP